MMRDAISAEDVLKRVHAIGDYYGFTSFATLAAENRGKRISSSEMPTLPPLDSIAESVSSLLKQCRETGVIPSLRQPLFVWHTNIAPGRPSPKTTTIQFHAIGTDRVIADTVIIRAIRALIHDLTKEEPVIRINTLGDKETRARFARELGNYFKKRSGLLPEDCLACARHDVFEAAQLMIDKKYAEDLPAPTDFLSDASRKRFEELLEYLEMTETPYELASDLLSRGASWSDVCFTITGGDTMRAWGSRYSDLAKLHFKTSMPAAGVVLKIETGGPKIPPIKSRQKTRFAFVHIGEEAKRESIKLAETIRRARLPLWQIIGLESLAEQMYFVDKMNPPYLLIMGRKEALEHSAILRNRNTQEEETIPLLKLTDRLKAFA